MVVYTIARHINTESISQLMQILKKRIWVHKNEIIDSLVIKDGPKIKFYSHTYLVKERSREWRPYVKWDNWEGQPHVDKFDANETLIEQKPCNEKGLEEIIKLVKIFRRNLITMDLSQL